MQSSLKNMWEFLKPKNYLNTGVDVGTTSTQVLGARADRKYAIFINDSDTPIYLAFAATAQVGAGVRLAENGGFYEITWNNPITAAVWAIHGGTGTKRLTVVEAW
jgi:hypothetical protein